MTYNKFDPDANSTKQLLFLTTTIIKALSPPQVQYVISLFQTGHPHQKIAQAASVSPGTISTIRKKYLSDLPKSSGGRLIKLFTTTFAIQLVFLVLKKQKQLPRLPKGLKRLRVLLSPISWFEMSSKGQA